MFNHFQKCRRTHASGKHELISTKNIVWYIVWFLGKFLFRKISISTFSGLRLTVENTYSAGTEVAGTHEYCFVREANNG